MPFTTPVLLRHGSLQVYVEPLDGCPDLERLAAGWPNGRPFIWLDSARHHPVTGRWSLFGADPWLTLTAHGERTTLQTSASTHILHDHPLQALHQVLRRYRAPLTTQSHARAIGLMGFLWSLRNVQYDDLEGAGWRAIADDEPAPDKPAP